MREMKILSPTAILGYGFPEESLNNGFKNNPDVIGLDAGSSDPGPYYLGEGKPFVPRNAVKRDLELIIPRAFKRKIPVIIGTAGGSGAKAHVEWCLEIIKEIAKKHKIHPKIAIIYADMDKTFLKKKLKQGAIKPLACAPKITSQVIDNSNNIVAQMGVDPIIKALDHGIDIVLGGRCYDPAVFAALPIKNGFDPGLAVHLGKIVECAAIAATPGSGKDCVLGIIKENSFVLKVLSNKRRFTVDSVAAHTLYEKSDPYTLPGPGGYLDLLNTKFTQITPSSVEVSGSKFVYAKKYTLKIEGTALIGYRTISVCGVRDDIMKKQIDSILAVIKKETMKQFPGKGNYLGFHIYGKDGVMADLEPQKKITSHELGIVIEAIAATQNDANTLCGFARSSMLHYGYPHRISTAGNLAFPFSPSDASVGKVHKFSIYHIVEVDDPVKIFETKYIKI
ncbi:MAG: 3-methylaspartate ammonia-lyase [Candidatus Firestonebacteria bacterium RIFOXYA2_FULL_40_8]|nr:MAG: 3-methylaspartate ammonia-lyase [Candidatus Firestonebacteria bacterium RIFOXYA2_FULL_40_8]